jgi:hypothetical protein
LLLGGATLLARDHSFDRIARHLESHYQMKPVGGMWFAGFMARWFSPSGVHQLRLAVFEESENTAPRDDRFEAFLGEVVEPGYTPFIRVRSKQGAERTHIYTRDAGSGLDLLLVTTEAKEATVLAMHLDPQAMEEWLKDPAGTARKKAHRHD